MNQRPLVPGFENGVLLMKEGETAELVMPSSQAFGKSVQVLPQGMREDIFEVTTHIPLTKPFSPVVRSEEHTSELQSRGHLVCRLLLDNKTLENSAQVREVFRQRSANGARSEGRRMGQPRPERLLRAD